MKLFALLVNIHLLLSAVSADRYIKTTSLLTCMSDSALTASYFDVKFYPENYTVVFDVDATTTISGNVTAKVTVIAYGINVISETFSLCDLGMSSLCPLSSGTNRIEVDSNYVISSSIADMIPGIAYTVPDLDARVRVLAYSTEDTTTPLACVEAVLSNGKTVQTKYAAWPIAAISGMGLITSGIVSVIGHSNTAAHIASNSISLFVYFQNLAITSMMAVSRVPPIAAAWAQNFQWSMGIINAGFMQTAITWYVQSTGGTSTVVVANEDLLSISVQKRDLIQSLAMLSGNLMKRSSDFDFDDSYDDTTIYTTDEHDTSDLTSKILVLRGIQRVSYLAGIEISNFFLTGIVFFLFFLFVLLILIASFKGFAEILIRSKTIKEHKFQEFRIHWSVIIKGTLFRLALIAFPQISLLCLWEFTERDSAAIVVVAVVMLVVVLGLLAYGATRVIILGRRSTIEYKTPAYLLYGDAKVLNRFGFLYVQFQAEYYWWLVPLLFYTLLRSIFVGLIQEYGKAQALCVFIVEIIYFAALCWKRPYMDKRTNVFNILIHLVNTFNSLMFLFFSNLFGQPNVVSSVCAVVFFVVNAIFALFLLIFTIVTCSLALIYKNPDTRYQPMKDDRVSFIPRTTGMEKSNKKDTELLALGDNILSGQQPEKLLNQNQNSDDESSFNTKFPQSKINGQYSRSDSISTNQSHIVPTSTVFGTSDNLKKPGVVFTSDTGYYGNDSSSEQVSNPFESSSKTESSNNPYSNTSNPYSAYRGNRY